MTVPSGGMGQSHQVVQAAGWDSHTCASSGSSLQECVEMPTGGAGQAAVCV